MTRGITLDLLQRGQLSRAAGETSDFQPSYGRVGSGMNVSYGDGKIGMVGSIEGAKKSMV